MGRGSFARGLGGALLVLAALLVTGGEGRAAGFALMEQSVMGLGNAFAGGAASAEDASTIYYNPAGLILLQGQQAQAAVHVIKTSFEFDNQGSTHLLTPLTGEGLTGHNGGNAGTWNAVPNLYYAVNLDNGWALGLGINVPFGLTTDYDEGWVGRYHTLRSEILTVNINPSIAYAVTKRLNIGVGLSAMYMDAELSQAIDFGTIFAAAGGTPQRDDGKVVLEADDWGYGANVGLLYSFTSDTRIGLSYRSQVVQHLKGDADFTVPANIQAVLTGLGSGAFSDGAASAQVKLPDSAAVSLYHRLSPELALMANVGWMNWSTLPELRIRFANPEQPDSVTTLGWQDAWQFGLGATWSPNRRWDLRIGAMYDQTPIPDAERRTPRLPDDDRIWTNLGASYHWSEVLSVDVAYAHLFVPGEAGIDKEPVGEDALRGGLKGEFENTGNIFGAQVSYRW